MGLEFMELKYHKKISKFFKIYFFQKFKFLELEFHGKLEFHKLKFQKDDWFLQPYIFLKQWQTVNFFAK